MAGRTFQYAFAFNGTQVGNAAVTNGVYLYDADDGTGDSLTIFGDVDPENLLSVFVVDNGANPPFNLTYVGKTTSGNGVIVNYSGQLYLYSDTNYANGTVVTYSDADYAVCFTTGTLIETACGPVAIEDLAVGNTAVTASGAERRICWIGRRELDCTGEKAHMAPVRVRANAFGSGVPERDVFLSPGHPVLVRQDGVEVLVPIMNLINGTTIERTQMSSVTYWHVELDEHDALIADGLPAESFFDMGSRGWFHNDLDDVLANPDLIPAGQHGRCREVAIDGPLVEAERRRLGDLFYADLSAQAAWPRHEGQALAV